jgi:GNAT superfamily N-acetyltransferase
VFLVKKSPRVAQLRMMLVEPDARGAGIGSMLVAECETFARNAGYRKIVLWTNSVLLAARRIYERAGYVKTGEAAGHMFGHDLIEETWELKL